VEQRAGQADASRFLGDDGELDRTEPLAAVVGGYDQADVAHVGELAPLRRLESARLLLHDTAAVLERRGLGKEVTRGAAQQLLVLGELEPHGQVWGRPSTRLAMMLRWTSDEPE